VASEVWHFARHRLSATGHGAAAAGPSGRGLGPRPAAPVATARDADMCLRNNDAALAAVEALEGRESGAGGGGRERATGPGAPSFAAGFGRSDAPPGVDPRAAAAGRRARELRRAALLAEHGPAPPPARGAPWAVGGRGGGGGTPGAGGAAVRSASDVDKIREAALARAMGVRAGLAARGAASP